MTILAAPHTVAFSRSAHGSRHRKTCEEQVAMIAQKVMDANQPEN
jgi:hypothetical protein